MHSWLNTTRGRIGLAALVIVLLVGGTAAGVGLRSASVGRAASAQAAQDYQATLTKAQASAGIAAAHRKVAAKGQVLADENTSRLNASAGKADDAVRTQLSGALDVLNAAIATGSDEEIVAASATVTKTGRVVENAVVSVSATQVRVAAEADAAKVAAKAATQAAATSLVAAKVEATRVAAETETARVASDAEVARVAAVAERARVDANAAAAQEAAAAVQYVDVVGSIAVVGWQLPGDGASTFVADEATGACHMLNGFDDIATGASVAVYDERGWIVGTGALSAGTASSIVPQGSGYVGACSFGFRVSVPEGNFFQIEVTHRGKSAFSRADIGAVALNLH